MASNINFFKGHPTASLLPAKEIAEATTRLLLNERDYDEDPENRHPLTYGSDPGAVWVREEIVKLSNKIFSPKNPSKYQYLNLTAGASYGIMNILAQTTLAHTGYTRQAFIITPTYFLINDTFIDAGFGGKITAIDEVADSKYGIDIELLESKLEHFEKENSKNDDDDGDLAIVRNPEADHLKKFYRYVLYCIPTFSNPGGRTYNLTTRLKLIELARKFDILIITDDVYDLLDYTQPLDKLPVPLPRLTYLDRETYTNEFGNTISNATFSKLIAPGLRFGYQEGVNEKLVYQLSQGGANVSGGTPSQLNSMIVGTLLKDGSINNILQTFRTTFSKRAKVLKASIHEYLPEGTTAYGFEGGYFVWVTLPEDYDSQLITDNLKTKGVVLANGDNFEVTGDTRGWGKRSVRLSISYLTENEISRGIELWGETINELYPQAKTRTSS